MAPTVFAFVVIIASLLARGRQMLLVFMVCCAFGATAAIEVTAIGGAPIVPAILALPFLMWSAVKADRLSSVGLHLRFPSAGAWLLYLVLWGAFTAFVLPRYFAGETYVFITSRSSSLSGGVDLVLLGPNSTNITQTCYAIAGLLTYLSVKSLLTRDDGLKTFENAIILVAAVNAIAAVMNLIEDHLGIPLGLEFVRNANYSILTGGEIQGLIRLQGLFAETSSFSGFTAPIFVFLASLWSNGRKTKITGPLALISIIFLAISTSTTAYVSVLAYAALLLSRWVFDLLREGKALWLGGVYIILLMSLVALCLVVLVAPDAIGAIINFFDHTLFRKLDSSSGVERGSWNSQAWTNFTDTFGLGAGLGSARASSFPLVLLSNVGLIGATLFCGFIVQTTRGAYFASCSANMIVSRAAGHALLVSMVGASLVGTMFDLSMIFYSFAAAAACGAVAHKKEQASPNTLNARIA